ncbi:EGF domain [Mactra antiquata]
MRIKVDVLLLTVFAVCVVISEAGYCYYYRKCSSYCYRQHHHRVKCGTWGWKRCDSYSSGRYTCYEKCRRAKCCSGYEGSSCSTPICRRSCSNGGTCIRPDVCSCRSGYSTPYCSDVDECRSYNGGCRHGCRNTHGSYYCTCNNGYYLGSNRKTCYDNDECKQGTSRCTQICHNTIGSYTCSCNVGFTLAVDGRTCIDVDECTDNTATCHVHCQNTIGSYQCYCEPGYMVDGDMCEEIDECEQDNGQCDHICLNIPGSYHCDCHSGYRLHNRQQCHDIDECLQDNGQCDHICLNEPGSYHCDCQAGYRLHNTSQQCQDIDECEEGISECSHGCLNHNGSYTCTCPSGFFLSTNNRTCEGVDDCVSDVCQHNGTCVDGHNSFTCMCNPGFIGTYCEEDKNECTVLNGGCQDNCTNSFGSYYCSCHENKTLLDDGLSCQGDIYEVVNVFELYGISRQLLSHPCFEAFITHCDGDIDLGIILLSTSEWFTSSTDPNTFYTRGITFIKLSVLPLPVSLQGIQITLTNNTFEIIHSFSVPEEDSILKDSTLTTPKCRAIVFDDSDIYQFVSANSFFKTFLSSITPQLPGWLRLRSTNDSLLAFHDMKSDLVYGSNMDDLIECSGAPVFENVLYSVFRFDSGFSLEILGDDISIPPLLEGRKFCLIVEVCDHFEGTIFFMIPESSRGLLLELPLFKSLKDEMNLVIKPRGIGLSLNDGINARYLYNQNSTSLWNGDHLFEYQVIQNANFWIGGDIEKEDKHFYIEGSGDVFFNVPCVGMMHTSLFRSQWDGLIDIKVSGSPIIRFKLLREEYTIHFTLATARLEAYVSIGETDRIQCGEAANPAGLFASLIIGADPFFDVPILRGWFSANTKLYVFMSHNPENIPSSIEHFSDDIFAVSAPINESLAAIETSLGGLEENGTNASISFVEEIKDEIELIRDIVDNDIKLLWDGNDINKLISTVERIEQIHQNVKHILTKFLDDVEFNFEETVQNLADNLQSAVNQIKSYIDNTYNSIVSSIHKEAGSYTDFGFRGFVQITIFGLKFPYMDVELVYSDGNLFQCTGFEAIIQFLDGEKAFRLLGGFESIPFPLGKFLALYEGRVGGAFATESNKIALQFQVVVNMLGIRTTGNLFITSSRGLYLYIEGYIWDIFLAQISVSAEVGKQWHELTFVLDGRFDILPEEGGRVGTQPESFQDSYLDGLTRRITQIADGAQKRLSDVQNKLSQAQKGSKKAQYWLEEKKQDVRNAKSAFEKAISELESAKSALEKAKGPFQIALNALESAQKNVDNLCKIRKCYKSCFVGIKCKICRKIIRGVKILYPCCRLTGHMFCFPNPICVLANIACRVIRALAYLVLETDKIFVRTPMLAFDSAEAALSDAQVVVDKSRVVLKIVEGILTRARVGLEFAKSILDAAKLALETVKLVIGFADDVLILVREYGVKNIIDVRNCSFRVELSTKDLSAFDVSCEVNAFRLGWKAIKITINFKNINQSIWQAARATISSLMNDLGNVSGRKRRSIEYETSSKVHRFLRIIRQSKSIDNLSSNDTIDVSQNINYTTTEDLDAANRIKNFAEKCSKIETLQDFLHDAFQALQEAVNDSKAYIAEVETVKEQLFQYNSNDNLMENITADKLGIDKDVAAQDYNMTYEDIDYVINETITVASNDPLLNEIKISANTSLENVKKETKSVESIDFVNIWYTAMDNLTMKYFDETDCNDFRDCMFFTISSLYELYESEEIGDVKDAIIILEAYVIESFQNETNTIIEASAAIERIVHEINRISNLNPFCFEAPKLTESPKNVSVLIGMNVTFNCSALGNPQPTYWWYKDDILVHTDSTGSITIQNITEDDNGIRINCMAGNIVANITSEDAYIITVDHDENECDIDNGYCEYECVNTVGSYECICPDGFILNETDGHGCTDKDECQDIYIEGKCEQECTNFIGGFSCSCLSGYDLGSDNTSCVDVDECADNNGQCDFQCLNYDGSFKCICNEGYVGNGTNETCLDVNECETNNGECEQNCTNTDGSFICQCNDGFELDTDKSHCLDIDECEIDNAECEHLCVNTEGSYNCICLSGYTLDVDLHQCTDVNECNINNGGCEHLCNNIPGFFFCSCYDGYNLDSNQTSCLDIDECNENNDNCSQICSNVQGSYVCSCHQGYYLAPDNVQCIDINECTEGHFECEHECLNTNGSYVCGCLEGYVLGDDGIKCNDIDECSIDNAGCEYECTNIEGSFTCSCPIGYALDDDKLGCSDIDECTNDNTMCDQTCLNTEGSYECSCMPGYEIKDDYSCTDVDECSNTDILCDHGCENVVGSFFCTCFDGFVLSSDEFACIDVNECSDANSNCDHACVNTEGSFYCACRDGYKLETDGFSCADIDECLLNNGKCEHLCVNTEGSYSCMCTPGYHIEANLHQCSDTDECLTDNGGCEHECKNTAGSFTCGCYDGYELASNDTNCVDINECLINNGGCNHNCTNEIGKFTCSCLPGYELDTDDKHCIDVNECNDDNGGCEQNCTNDVGSYTCECMNGFDLQNELTCVDKDECALELHLCSQQCENDVGSFTCSCDNGYTIGSDGFTCLDINECTSDNGGCDHNCKNEEGTFVCSCMEGYTIGTNLSSCVDIDECNVYNGGCEQQCNNIAGSYNCACSSGYMLSNDLHHCYDVNECEINNGGCSQICNNTIGSFSCSCYVGYDLYGSECMEKDECVDNNGGCEHICENTEGSFECHCKNGYELNGLNCVDINECLTDKGDCDQTCLNTAGSFECSCLSGYELDSLNCVDTNECLIDKGGCDQTCLNTDGSFECSCLSGYEQDGLNCADINECLTDNGGCDQICENIPGSYICQCESGFMLDPYSGSCQDIDECDANSRKCHQICTNTIGSFVCGCDPSFTLDFFGYGCLGRGKKSFQAFITVIIETLRRERYKRSDIVTSEKIQESLEIFYNEYTSVDVTVIITSTRDKGSTVEVEYVVVYDKNDTSDIVTASINLSSETELYYDGGTISGKTDMFTDKASKCEVYETIIQQCENGYLCEVVEDDPICRPKDKDQYEFNYLTVAIPLPVILLLIIAIGLLILRRVCVRRRREMRTTERFRLQVLD